MIKSKLKRKCELWNFHHGLLASLEKGLLIGTSLPAPAQHPHPRPSCLPRLPVGHAPNPVLGTRGLSLPETHSPKL